MTIIDKRPILLDEMIDEVQREIANRKYLYGRLVDERKMPRFRADRQIAIMEAVLDILLKQPDPARRLAA